MVKTVLDKAVRKIWSLNQLKQEECFTGIPRTEYYQNKNDNQFIHLMLDAGYSICHIYFLIFDYPEQKILGNKFHNSFELVKTYRIANEIAIDENITMFHDIDWKEIIDWINSLRTLKIRVISKNMNGFKNIEFVNFSEEGVN